MKENRKRPCKISVRFTQKELDALDEKVMYSGFTREVYIRQILAGSKVYAPPPLDYHQMKNELRSIGVNLNRLVLIANSTGNIYHSEYVKVANQIINYLRTIDQKMRDASRPMQK